MSKLITKSEIQRICYKARSMGATQTDFSNDEYFSVWFEYIHVHFRFYPFEIRSYVLTHNIKFTKYAAFSSQEQADVIKKYIDTALEFMEYLKEFAKQLPDRE